MRFEQESSMNIRKFAQIAGLVSRRDSRLKATKKTSQRIQLDFMPEGLEKRQLLATFNYNSGTGLLAVETSQNSETLSIVSNSDAGNYTIVTSGIWSGTSTADVGNSGTNLFVNSTANISLIQITNNAANSGSAFYFGSSTGNFVDNLTVNFSNSSSGVITVANATSFVNGSNLNLTSTGNQITVSSPTSANSTGAISLTGRNIVVRGNITANAGDITLYGNGGGVYQTGSFDGVCISGSSVNVNTTNGNITIDGRGGLNTACAGVSLLSSKVQAGGSGCVTITGMSGDGSQGVAHGISSYGANVTANSGSIIFNGTSCGSGTDSMAIWLMSTSNISATSTGNVTITGFALQGTRSARGINVSNSYVTTSTGLLTLNGTSCGTAGGSYGVDLYSSANISATGTGNVTITGTAARGTGGSAFGICIGEATVTINTGSLTVNGTSFGTGSDSRGVSFSAFSNITATGAGNITISGTSSSGTTNACGIYVSQSNVTTTSGSLTLNGTSCGTGAGSSAVILRTSANISATGAGNVTITGVSPRNLSTDIGINATDTGATVYSNGGLITLTANTLKLIGTVNSTSAGNVLIQTFGSGVNLGNGTDTTANLGLSQAELNQITANVLTIGNSSTGTIVNTDAISRNNATLGTNLTLISGNSITQTAPGNLTISGSANFVSSGVGTAGNITLGNVINNFGTVQANGTNVTINDTNAVILGTTSATSLTVTSAGAITQTGAATVSGIANFTNSGSDSDGNITLANSTNDFSTVRACGTNITITNTNSTILGMTNAMGCLTVNSTNKSISQAAGTNITVTGTANFVTAGAGTDGNITLGNISNVFGIFAASGTNITVTDVLTQPKGIKFGRIVATGDLFANAVNGPFTQANGTNITVAGTANFVTGGTGANGSITLNNSTNNFGTVTASGTNISINDLNNITFGAITANGDFTVQGDNTTSCISVTGPVNATSGSGNVSLTGRNIVVTGNISTAAGGITLTGNNGTYQTGTFDGVQISGAAVNVNTTGGSIVIDGRGASGSSLSGVNLTSSKVQAGGSGCVTITGISGDGTNAGGVGVASACVTTTDGTLKINGTSCATGNFNIGLYLGNSSVASTGVGNVNLTGFSGAGTNYNYGFAMSSGSKAMTNNGSIMVYGKSLGMGANENLGLFLLDSSRIIAGGLGTISITGETANASQVGILEEQQNSQIRSSGGLITLTANSMYLPGTMNATSAGNVLIQTLGAGVNLGGDNDTANLGLTNSELNRITSNQLTIGNSTTGAIVNTAAISRTGNLTLISRNSITQTGAGNLAISGKADFVTSGMGTAGNITLNNSTNNFATVTACGTNLTIVDTNAVGLGTISATGLKVNSGGAITQTGPANVSTGTANFTSSGVGTAGNITLGISTNDFATVTACGTNITVYDLNNIMIGAVTASGDFKVQGVDSTSCISVTGPINTTGGSGNLSLTATTIALSSNITTNGTQTFIGNVTINGNVSLLSGGSAISVNGTINRLAPTPGNLSITSYTSNATWTVPAGITLADVLVVGGGGGGGNYYSGGGGGGGGQVLENLNVSVSGSVSIIVGRGDSSGSPGLNGANSSFGTITANGGGGGSASSAAGSALGWTGGGGSGSSANGIVGVGGSSYKGGNGGSSGGGGGGAGANGIDSGSSGGAGGAGAASSITGSLAYYGGGGGGGGFTIGGGGGAGGGGSGGYRSTPGTNGGNGTANTGGGGGGGPTGGSGGSGIVIVKTGIAAASTTAYLTINAGSGAINLSGSIGSTTTLDGLSFTGANLALPSVSTSSLTMNSTGTLTQTGAANVTGTSNLVASGNIALGNSTNDFGTVTACGTNITISDTNALSLVSIAGNGTVQITAQNVTITSTVNATTSGSVLLIPTSGTVVDLGTKSTGNFGLTSTEIGNITANLLTIGNSSTGNIEVTTAISRSANCSLALIANTTSSCISVGSAISATGTGVISLTGNSLVVTNHISTAGGLITLTANSVNLTGTVNATSAGNVTIQPIGNGTLINLGNGTDTSTTLGLSANEIGQITARTLTIGSATAGNITISAPVTWPTNLTMLTAGNTTDNITGWANLTVGGTVIPSPPYIMVTNTNDSGAGSLRDAIANAATSTGDDQIQFDPTISGNTIALLTPLTINDTGNLTIVGLGASNLTISGNGSSGIFNVLTRASISCLTLTAGYGTNLTNGGAIYSNTTLGLSNLVISNSSANLGSAVYQTGGSLTVTSSNIVNSIYLTGSGLLTVSGSLNSLGNLNVNSGSATVAGGTIGATIVTGTLTATGGSFASIDSGGTTNLNGGNVTGATTVTAGTITSNVTLSNLTVNGGTANLTGGSANVTTVSGGILLSAATLSSLAVNSGLATVSGGSVTGATTAASTLNLTGGTLNTLSVTVGISTLSGGSVTGLSVAANGTANISAGTVGATINAGALNITGGTVASLNTSGTTSLSGGSVTGTTTVTAGTLTSNITLANLTVSGGTANLTGGSAATVTQSGGSFNAINTTISSLVTNGGNANVSGGVITNPISGSGNASVSIINYGQSLAIGQLTANSLTVNVTSGTILQQAGSNLNLTSGSFTAIGNVTLSNATNNFGTITASGANITINDADSVNIGNIQSTGNLTITTGGTTNLGGNITTAGDQQFNSPVMLTNNITLRTTANGSATFAYTLNGYYSLRANLGGGSLVNLGAVGSSTVLNLDSAGNITGTDLNLTIAPGAVIGSITGSGSNNTITIQTLANETANIVISGTNSGNITTSGGTSIGSFSGIKRLVGGAGSDTFKFVNNSALLNGTIDGGSGTNALNYGGTTKPTFINLGTGQATGVTSTTSTGVVTNIQNVFGGTGNDYLTGSAASNVMDGGSGDDTMSGLGGNDIMVGNYGADNMNGGAGIDILIGGYVELL